MAGQLSKEKIGVNTFEKPSHLQEKANVQRELIRSTTEEKEQQINNLREFWRRNEAEIEGRIADLKRVSQSAGNIFNELMETTKYCSLGQISNALYKVGGQYRRNM